MKPTNYLINGKGKKYRRVSQSKVSNSRTPERRTLAYARSLMLFFLLICSLSGYSQVTLTATSGTATGSFTTLKGAFDAINAGTHKGDIVIHINNSTTETASASLTASAATSTSAPYYTSINIYPTTSGLSITGSVAAPLINLNGADNVTIDGRVNATGTTKSLTISNTSALATAGTSTIRFIGDASSNTVQYCTLKGSSTDAAAGIIFFSTTSATTGNDNNTITNNDITCAADANRPLNAVYALGTSSKNNDNNTISNNNIYDFLSRSTASQGINIGSYNSGYTISGNSFYETASFSASAAVNYNVILISAATGTGNGFTVSGNYIGGSAASCGGTAWTKTSQNTAFTAISVTTATGTANNIQGNTIQNINWTNAGTSDFTGIYLSGATVANIGTVTGNTIGAATGTGSIIFTSNTTATDFYAINIAGTDVVDCQNNTIGSIQVDNAATNATNFYGIAKSATAGTTTISNNTIGSTSTASSIHASSISSTAANIQSVYGIQSAGTGTITISGNTIANMVNATTNSTTTAAGLISGIYVSGGTNTISDNTVRDLSNANANTNLLATPSVSGIAVASSSSSSQTVSGNTVYNLSNSFTSFAGGVIGIYFNGPPSPAASSVRGNFIHSLSVSGASSTTAGMYGIKMNAGTTTYSNNIVSLGGTTKTDLFGIYENGAAWNDNTVLFNTVYIGGSMVSGAANFSYALYSAVNTNTRNFRNNILVNARSTVSGASKHYALYVVSADIWLFGPFLTSNYNNYFVSGTGGVLGYVAGNKTSLPIVPSNDANSIVTNPTFTNAGGTSATDYTPTVPGAAVTGTGITVDYAGNTRATNVSMGALEVKLGANAPTNVVGTAGVGSASLSFTAPTDIGGGAITNYQYSLDNGATWITPSPAVTSSPFVISELTGCTAYTIRIRAMNATGAGTASSSITVTPRNGQAGIIWTWRTPAAENGWRDVTYGNGLFVAVSSNGAGNRVMTSPDGINWTSRASAVNNDWQSVCYGNGLFVAVSMSGSGNRVMTSPDGINWTSRTTPVDNGWVGVTYGNGLFVAVSSDGAGNRVMTSPDGITWTTRTPATNNAWTSVTYGNGLFVAVAETGTGNRVMTSPDGINWTSRTSAANNSWFKVTYGNGLFVAVSINGSGNRVMTSPDGITWTSRTSAANKAWSSVTYGNGLFVAVASNGAGNRVMTSPDGINWTSRASAVDNAWNGVTYANGLFVAVAVTGSGDHVMTSAVALTPGTPSITAITPSVNSASVAFTAPSDTGASAITNYEYSIDNGLNWVTPSPAVTTSPMVISGLTAGTTYPVQLRTVNSVGSGCGSAAVNTTTTSGCVNPTAGGTIAADQSGNSPFDPATFTSSTSPSGHSGTLEYKWQSSTTSNSAGFSDIASSNSETYDAGPLTQTTWFKRLARVDCQSDWTNAAESNILQVTVITCTPPAAPTGLACYQTASFDTANCQWVVTGTPNAPITTTSSVCDSYTWTADGQTYTVSGTYSYASNCQDYILNLTVTASTSNTTTESACDSYAWSANGTTYTQSGSYTSVSGCATEILNLTITPGTSNTITASACDNYTWSVDGQTYTQSGSYTSVSGCATEILVLSITPSTSNTTAVSACDSYNWSFDGLSTYTQSGTHTAVIGCSTEILVLTITASTSNTTTAAACDSYTWAVDGQTYTQSGSYSSINGCATEVLALTIEPLFTNTTTASACDSYTWTVNGQTYAQSGNYTSVSGCATEILNLTISTSGTNTTTAAACDSYTWSVNGQTYTQSGNYTSVSGCATEILNLSITTSTSNTTTASACDTYTWAVDGQTYTQSGTYSSVNGCATEILVLSITPSTSNTTAVSACDSYNWSFDGLSTYTQSGTHTAVIGCSTEILVLTITASTSNTTTAAACDSYTWAVDGQTYTQSGSYSSINGCATEVLALTIEPSVTNTTTASACDSYTWSENGQTYTQSGTYTAGAAASFYNTLAAFTTAAGNAGYTLSATETFDGIGSGFYGGGLTGTVGSVAWSAGASGGLYVDASAGSQVLSTNNPEPLTISFTPGVTAVGANMFLTNISFSVVPGNITLNLSDGSTASYATTSGTDFGGFTATGALINSITISSTTGSVFVTVDNLVVGTGTLAPSCTTDVLNLTITPSTSNTTTASACDSYTWAVDGQTYTQSGTYSSVSGCATEILNLTITASTTTSATETATGSYTWSVDGQTYTQSGTYTSVSGCATSVLNLTIGTSCTPTPQPGIACYETATWNTTTCQWDVTGTQPQQPTLACYETASFNNNTCQWDVTGTQPTQPSIACYETATFNATTCQWDVAGTQPSQPTTACYETATFNTTTCQWEVTGTQPTQPTLACYETATFNSNTCQWDVTGTQPTQPTLACYETATFNTNTCQWDVTGTQPTQPTLACYESATFNSTTCQWDVTGTQPAQPGIACYETATFNGTTCQWDVTGTPNAAIVTSDAGCNSYTWSADGNTYTASGTYSYSNNCQDYVLNLTINTTASYYVDADGDGYGVGAATSSCTPINGSVTIDGDCDDTNSSVNPGATELCNNIDDDCDGSVDDNIPALVTPGSITGPALTCRAGVAGVASYSIAPVAGAGNYVWTVPSGFTITGGQGTSAITVSFTASAMQSGISGQLCVTAGNSCNSSAAPLCTTIEYQIAAPITPPSISGPAKVCAGATATFSVSAVARATSYTWTVPTGVNILSGQGSNVITAEFVSGFTGGNIGVTASNVCGTSPQRTKQVSQNALPSPTAVQGPKSGLCSVTGANYTVSAVTGATSYNWGITGNGATIVSGQGTTSIVVDFAQFSSVYITVQAVNGCGSSQTRSLFVTGSPGRPGTISGSKNVCRNATEAYSVATVDGTGPNGYAWTTTGAGNITSGQGTKNITITWVAAASGQGISVSASNACGSGEITSLSGITVSNCPRLGDSSSTLSIEAYPNPADDRVHLVFNATAEHPYRLRMVDMAGKLVAEKNGIASEGRNEDDFLFGSLQSGVYILEMQTGENTGRFRLVVN